MMTNRPDSVLDVLARAYDQSGSDPDNFVRLLQERLTTSATPTTPIPLEARLSVIFALLTEHARTILIAYNVDRKTLAEIGTELRIGTDTARRILQNALFVMEMLGGCSQDKVIQHVRNKLGRSKNPS